MKIALLHGAETNAGDFLIKNRTISLLKFHYPNCEINEYYRNRFVLDPILDEINSYDIMILAGGPGYANDIYPNLIPLTNDLSKIKIPIMILGMGWFAVNSNPYYTYQYAFDEHQKKLYDRVVSDTKFLGCRDYFTVNVLRNNGYNSALMTGCPAWYDLDYVNQTKYNGLPLDKAKNVCISDCGSIEHIPQLIKLIDYARFFFVDADIKFVVHKPCNCRDTSKISEYDNAITKCLNRNNVEKHIISNSSEGFSIYNNCDVHLGFRVHAHIYNLSIRNFSILIEEDCRGSGVNSALGLTNIPTSLFGLDVNNNITFIKNDFFTHQVQDALLRIHNGNYKQLNHAYETMSEHFDIMSQHIKSIEKYI